MPIDLSPYFTIPTAVTDTLSLLQIAGSVVVALLQCFFGFRLVRQWISFVGFLVGAWIGYRLWSGGILPEGSSWYFSLLLVVGIGILVSVLSYRLFKLGLFLFCGSIAAYAVSTLVLPTLQQEAIGRPLTWIAVALPLLAFFIAGFLAVKCSRIAIILISSIAGAWTAAYGLTQLLPRILDSVPTQGGLFAVLALLGILIQFFVSGRQKG